MSGCDGTCRYAAPQLRSHECTARCGQLPDTKAYGGGAAFHRHVDCECGHGTNVHEGDEYGFCLVCDCNHYRPVIRAAVES